MRFDRVKPRHTLRTFADVDRLWQTVVEPHVPEFRCLEADFRGKGRTVPPDSVWHENSGSPVWQGARE